MFKMQTFEFRELIFKFYFVPFDKYLNFLYTIINKYIIYLIWEKFYFLKNFIKTYDCNLERREASSLWARLWMGNFNWKPSIRRLVRCLYDPYTINSCISIHHCFRCCLQTSMVSVSFWFFIKQHHLWCCSSNFKRNWFYTLPNLSSFCRRVVIQRWSLPNGCMSLLTRYLLLHGSWGNFLSV
jgi:hypothetical protein